MAGEALFKKEEESLLSVFVISSHPHEPCHFEPRNFTHLVIPSRPDELCHLEPFPYWVFVISSLKSILRRKNYHGEKTAMKASYEMLLKYSPLYASVGKV